MDIGIRGSYHSGDGAVTAQPCNVYGVVACATATAGTVILRDGGATSTILFQVATPAANGDSKLMPIPNGLAFATSCYVALSNATATVLWK